MIKARIKPLGPTISVLKLCVSFEAAKADALRGDGERFICVPTSKLG